MADFNSKFDAMPEGFEELSLKELDHIEGGALSALVSALREGAGYSLYILATAAKASTTVGGL